MGEYSFIPKKKICPVLAVKMLGYTISSVSVPKPVFAYLRTLRMWTASYNSRMDWLALPSLQLQCSIITLAFGLQPAQYIVCECWLKILTLIQNLRTFQELSLFRTHDYKSHLPHFWGIICALERMANPLRCHRPIRWMSGQAEQVTVSLTTFKTLQHIRYQCVELVKHQISHHRSRKSDNDREWAVCNPAPTWQVLTGNTGVSGQMQVSVSLCSDWNTLPLYNFRQSYHRLCTSIHSVQYKLCGLLVIKDLEF